MSDRDSGTCGGDTDRDPAEGYCPECGEQTEERNPIFDWWMCDACEIAFNDDGEVTAR